MRRLAAAVGLVLVTALVGCSGDTTNSNGPASALPVGATPTGGTAATPSGPARLVTFRVVAPAGVSAAELTSLTAKTADVVEQRLRLLGVDASVVPGASTVTVRLPGTNAALPAQATVTGLLTIRPVVNTTGMTATDQASPGALTAENKSALTAAMGQQQASALEKEYTGPGCPAATPVAAPKQWAVMCSRDRAIKYLLEPAAVTSADVSADVSAVTDSSSLSTGAYLVDLPFTESGQKAFTRLTSESVGKTIAIAIDNTVQTAATVNETIPGNAQISGSFTENAAAQVVAVLKAGRLPATLVLTSNQQVS